MQKIIKRAALSALVMQVCIFLMAHVVAFLYIPIRMILSERLIQDAVFGVITLVIEFLVMITWMKRTKQNNRNLQLREMVFSILIAFSLHFLISLINGFYVYTAGSGVATLGHVFFCAVSGQYTNDHRAVPLYFFLIVFAFKLLAMFPLCILGFHLGEKKSAKERNSILKQ